MNKEILSFSNKILISTLPSKYMSDSQGLNVAKITLLNKNMNAIVFLGYLSVSVHNAVLLKLF